MNVGTEPLVCRNGFILEPLVLLHLFFRESRRTRTHAAQDVMDVTVPAETVAGLFGMPRARHRSSSSILGRLFELFNQIPKPNPTAWWRKSVDVLSPPAGPAPDTHAAARVVGQVTSAQNAGQETPGAYTHLF